MTTSSNTAGRLQGKRALITGGTSGIGLETARQFIAEGARVIVTGSSTESTVRAQAELGEQATVLQVDASRVAELPGLVRVIGETFGQLDAVFVNAGIAQLAPLAAWDEAAYDRVMAVNLKGPFFLLQALLPVLANPASIVLNTSVNAHIGMPNSSVYAASKAALLSLARTLSGELIGRGIRVNAVSPGPVATPLYGKLGLSAADLQKTSEAILGLVPAARFGQPSEIAKAVVFLASDEASFTVGAELLVDGGMSL
jgi:NAD(P)-dependent dehydrogenase (short-subunit alcohol dehydrogenase family)